MLKICYLNLLWSRSQGLYKKFLHQSHALKNLSVNKVSITPIAIIPRNHLTYFNRLPSAKLIPIDLSMPQSIQYLFYPFIVWPKLKRILAAFDAVIMRWTVPTRGLYQLSCNMPVFTEHHSKEIEELRCRKDIKSLAQLLFEKYYGTKSLANVQGIIGVTDEIREYELKRAGTYRPSCVCSNGIAVGDVPLTPPKPFTGNCLKILCVASSLASWHGIDRIVEAIKGWDKKGPRVELWLVGRPNNYFIKLSKADDRFKHLGILTGEDLDKVFSECHIAAGSLALERKGLREACPLKVREYVARGMPFIYSYDDPDLSTNVSWCLKLPPGNSPIDMEMVLSFAEEVNSVPNVSIAMREFARQRLDWSKKMLQLIEFVLSTL